MFDNFLVVTLLLIMMCLIYAGRHHLEGSTADEIQFFKYFSPYDKYIAVTTSTPVPRVS